MTACTNAMFCRELWCRNNATITKFSKVMQDTKKLKRLLQTVAKVVPTTNPLPIVECVLIKDGFMYGTDLEQSIKVPFVCSGPPVIVELKLLRDVLRTCKQPQVEFMSCEKGLQISNGKQYYRVLPSEHKVIEDFPKLNLDVVSPAKAYKFDAKTAEAIGKAGIFVSEDDLRPAMCGVYISDTHVVATDSHKLIYYKHNCTNEPLPVNYKADLGITLSGCVTDVMAKHNEPFTMWLGAGKNGRAVIEFESNITYSVRKVDATYPDWNAVVPEYASQLNKITIPTAELKVIVEQSKFAQNRTTNMVIFTTKTAEQKLNISAFDTDMEREFSNDIACKVEGADIEIAFNSKFLLQILNNCGDTVEIAMSTPTRTSIVNEQFLLMPVMIKK